MTVSWAPPVVSPFPISAYEVTPWIEHVKQTPVRFNSTATTQVITGLRNFTAYTFTVAAINAFGDDSASSQSDSVTPTGPASPITFATPASYATTGASSVAVGDVNDDGLSDVAASTSANLVSVRLANGDGTLGAPTDVAIGGTTPRDVALLDVNGDGALDIVTVNWISWDVSVVRGDGTGHFGALARYATGAYPWRVASADLNGDGALDLVTVNIGSNTLSVLLGQGDGTFAPHQDLTTPNIPRGLTIADFNTDGALDLALVGGNGSFAEVRPGNGDGTFGPATPLTPGIPALYDVAAGDLDGDGHTDLVIEGSGEPALWVLLGDGSGAFASAGVFPTTSCQCRLQLLDLDSDGDLDAVVAGTTAASVSVGNGDGTFATNSDFVTDLRGGSGAAIGVGDFNDDGLSDLAVAATDAVSVLLNRPGLPGAPTITAAQGSDRSATLTWIAPVSNDTYPVTAYLITPYVNGVAQTPTTFNSTATTETVTGLTNATYYAFTVQAVNAVGVGKMAVSNQILVGRLPNAPTMGTATAGDTTATVSWTAPTPVGYGVNSYIVTPYVNGVAQTPTTFNSTATTETVTGLTNGIAYQFRVQGVNRVGPGAYSGYSNTVTPFVATAPGAPTIGTATAGAAQATVSWTAPASDGGSPINGYTVTPYIGSSAQAPRQFFTNATTQTIKNLVSGTTYTFTVEATNTVGTGPESQHSNSVTPS